MLIRVNTVLRGITMVLSAAFLEKKLVSFGKFPYALYNLTFTNKLLVKGQNKKQLVSLKKFFILQKPWTKILLLVNVGSLEI